jgi:hypothetical protein
MCIECHTPRDESGNLIRDEYLDGAPVPVKAPPYPEFNWALKAPAIAGLIGYTKDQGVRLLTSGVTRDGRVPDPPMPPFRMSVRDAESVVAYLKKLAIREERGICRARIDILRQACRLRYVNLNSALLSLLVFHPTDQIRE